jgi:hypothetical protein
VCKCMQIARRRRRPRKTYSSSYSSSNLKENRENRENREKLRTRLCDIVAHLRDAFAIRFCIHLVYFCDHIWSHCIQ